MAGRKDRQQWSVYSQQSSVYSRQAATGDEGREKKQFFYAFQCFLKM